MKAHTRARGPTVNGSELALPPELCVHHDVIEYPHGPISIGICKKCGRQREYQTPYESPIYGNTKQPFPKILLARAEDWE